MRTSLIILIIISSGLIVFSNSLGNDFIWDDEFFVITNQAIKSLDNIPSFFTSHNALASGVLSEDSYRPLVPLSFSLDYRFWGLNPLGYHFVNLFVHILNALLIFYLIMFIVKDKIISMYAALVFLVHPVQVESVTWICGRSNVLFLCFFILSLILYVKYAVKPFIGYYAAALLSFLCALMSKEMSVTLPLVIIMYEIFFLPKKDLLKRSLRILPFFAILFAYVLIRFAVIGKVAQSGYFTGSPYTTFLTMLKGVAYYIKILVYPSGLCADYRAFPVSYSIKEPFVLFSCVVLVSVFISALYLFRRVRAASFGIFWFFVTLSPVLNIIPLKIAIAERFLYLPMAGYAIFLSVMGRFFYIKYRRRLNVKYVIISAQLGLLLVYGVLTADRNTVWADEVVFYEDIVNKFPGNLRAGKNLSIAYMRREQDLDKALGEARRIFMLDPDNSNIRILLSRYYLEKGEPVTAERLVRTVLEKDPVKTEAYMVLASSYIMQAKLDAAIDVYEYISVNGMDSNYGALSGMALVHTLKGENSRAVSIYERIISKPPSYDDRGLYSSIYLMLGDIYAETGDNSAASRVWSVIVNEYRFQEVPYTIVSFLFGNISQDELIAMAEKWPPEARQAAFYHIAMKKEKSGDVDGAREYYRKCAEINTFGGAPYGIMASRKLSC